MVCAVAGQAAALAGPTQASSPQSVRISSDDLKPLIEAALSQQGVKAKVRGVQLQAAIYVNSVNALKLRKLRFDSAIRKYRAWFVLSDLPGAVPFEAMAELESDGTAAGLRSEIKQALIKPAVLIHRGQIAAMELDGEGFQATLSVTCLEEGTAEKTIRVREQTTKQIYRAQVVGPGAVRAMSREN